jgi:hypothetical protein
MKAKRTSRQPASAVTPVPAAPEPTREQVQVLAHAIWMDRGCPQGCDVEIWLEAERQLRAQPGPLEPGAAAAGPDSSLDPDRSDAARVDREMGRMVSPPEQRSPTSL